MKTTKPYSSIPRKPIKASQLIEGDVVLFGGSKSGAFHKIIKMHGVKSFKKTTRMVYDWKFYAIIRDGKVIFDENRSYDPINKSMPYPNTIVEVIHNQISKNNAS